MCVGGVPMFWLVCDHLKIWDKLFQPIDLTIFAFICINAKKFEK